jgi:hypothetical protein
MARRTLSDIYDQIASEKANMSSLNNWFTDKANPGSVLDDHQTLLQDLTSASKVAYWRLIIFIITVAIWVHEELWLVFKSEVIALIESEKVHTIGWYTTQAKNYQHGHDILMDSGKPRYAEYNADARIIKHCSSIDNNKGGITLKLATEVNGVKQPLSASQMLAFRAYMSKIRDGGVVINYISTSPDQIVARLNVYYDPILISADGSLISDSSVKPAEVAFLNYLDSIEFDGVFNINKCFDDLITAEGIADAVVDSLQAQFGNNDYTDIIREREAYSGYFIVDALLPISTTFNYIADV